jgi:TM2 domain-containing membrane protein YozV
MLSAKEIASFDRRRLYLGIRPYVLIHAVDAELRKEGCSVYSSPIRLAELVPSIGDWYRASRCLEIMGDLVACAKPKEKNAASKLAEEIVKALKKEIEDTNKQATLKSLQISDLDARNPIGNNKCNPDEKFCLSCGTIIKKSMGTCPKCGNTQYQADMLNKTTLLLLTLFLGGIGCHKFYLRKPIQGIMYLLFSWTFIPIVIAILELIVYATKSEEELNRKYGKL